jgi:hypothetical protein
MSAPNPPTLNGKPVSPYTAAFAEPVVRKILELFDGRLIDVKHGTKK